MKKAIHILSFLIASTFFLGAFNPKNFTQPLRPAQLIISPNDTICQGQSVTLKLLYSTGNLLWNTGATSDSIVVSPTSSSSYYIINDYGGSSPDTFFVTITVIPDVKPIINVTPNGIVCKGDTAFLTLVNPFNNVLWSTNSTSASISFLADSISSFYVINDAGGKCPDTTSIYLQIKSKNYTLIDIHGGGCPGAEVNINVINPRGTILWSTGSNSPYLNITPDTTTTYIFVNNAFTKCADTLAVEIYVPLKIKPLLSIFPKDSVCEKDILKIHILNPYKSIIWSNGSSDSVQYIQAGLSNGLTVINDYNGVCPDTTIVNVKVINIDSDIIVPNCFTPNGDGVNDIFKITDIINSDYKMTIFNRWGLQMFESNATGRDWNGNFNNLPVADGVYFWVLDFKSYCDSKQKTKKGFVNLFR